MEALRPVYHVYENVLWREIEKGAMPRSVAVILDGNRRWATLFGYPAEYGHEAGYAKLKEALNWFWEVGVKEITIYALSTENISKRSKSEVSHLLALSAKGLAELAESRDLYEKRVRVKVIGDFSLFSKDLVDAIGLVEQKTAANDERLLQIALGYGGRDEIVKAVKSIATRVARGELSPEDINEQTISSSLYTAGSHDPDLIIRTGGEERLSNFLLWQSSYSELVFLDTYWPQFRKIDLYRAIRTFQRRKRRFGS
jgi:tritrans,polycis-undecaprenyl-diphosphate synthase [geranylgeranyl-diphosphate specific]